MIAVDVKLGHLVGNPLLDGGRYLVYGTTARIWDKSVAVGLKVLLNGLNPLVSLHLSGLLERHVDEEVIDAAALTSLEDHPVDFLRLRHHSDDFLFHDQHRVPFNFLFL